MIGALIILGVTALIGFLLWLFDRKNKVRTPAEAVTLSDSVPEQEECCGMHAVCEKQLLTPLDTEIEYFDDEELDAFAGRMADSYDESEIEAFRDVLLTLPAGEVTSWARSMQLRGITLPASVREELLMIVAEQRNNTDKSSE